MSSLSNHNEQGNSNQSLSTRGDSELGSHYLVESGLYMTSFAATIFIAFLATVGVLLVTLVITLAVLLESCQSKTTGVVQQRRSSDDYDYCRNFALHAELNSLGLDGFPPNCKDYAYQYVKANQYRRDLDMAIRLVEDYFRTLTPNGNGLDVILMDVDGILSSSFPHHSNGLQYWFNSQSSNNWMKEREGAASILFLELHKRLVSSGWSLVLFTRKPEQERNATIDSLISAGYSSWSSLIMRSESELGLDGWEYLSRRRVELHNQGFSIVCVISDKWDALTGPSVGKRSFKFPNPIYFRSHENVKVI